MAVLGDTVLNGLQLSQEPVFLSGHPESSRDLFLRHFHNLCPEAVTGDYTPVPQSQVNGLCDSC